MQASRTVINGTGNAFASNEIGHPQQNLALRTSSPISIFSRGLPHYIRLLSIFCGWMLNLDVAAGVETFVVFVASHLPERGITIEVVKKVRASARKVRDIAQNLSTELSSRDRPTDCTTHNSNNELDFLTLLQVLWTLSSLLNMICICIYISS